MNAHKQFTWLLISSLAIVAVFGLALSSPSSAVGQARSTPTRVPPGPRTLPPGIRLTPTPVPPTQPAQGNPEGTTTPTPVILLPKSGGSLDGGDQGLGLVAVAGLGLFALGLILTRRRSRTE